MASSKTKNSWVRNLLSAPSDIASIASSYVAKYKADQQTNKSRQMLANRKSDQFLAAAGSGGKVSDAEFRAQNNRKILKQLKAGQSSQMLKEQKALAEAAKKRRNK